MNKEKYFTFFAMCFVTVLLISNIAASNTFYINDYLSLSAAELLFPLSYVINDLMIEFYDFKRVSKVILTGLILVIFSTVCLYLTTFIPSNYTEYNTVFGVLTSGVIGITFASFLAYLIGSFTNAFIMTKFKERDKEKKFFKRAILSSLVAEFFDSLVFITLCCLFASSYYSWDKLFSFVLTITAIKISFEIIIFPIMNMIKNKVNSKDKIIKDNTK